MEQLNDFIEYTSLADWLNSNQGVLGIGLFLATALFGWFTGIFNALRRRPSFKIRLIPGPTFVCTFGVDKQHNEYQVHRTGVALYVDVANIGSAPSSIRSIQLGYHWAVTPFSWDWVKHVVGWFWLENQAVCINDFQVEIGENIKFYQFLTQQSSISGKSADTYLEIGKSTVGVIYFEQSDSWGGCFPRSVNGHVRIKLSFEDAFGRWHSEKFWVQKITLSAAMKYNPSFGQTLSSLNGEESPFELPLDDHGNIMRHDVNGPPARS